MYKIGIIGDRESVLCFSALGFSVFEVENAKSAETVLKNAAESKEFAVLFITEELARSMDESIGRYKDLPCPPSPSYRGEAAARAMEWPASKKPPSAPWAQIF